MLLRAWLSIALGGVFCIRAKATIEADDIGHAAAEGVLERHGVTFTTQTNTLPPVCADGMVPNKVWRFSQMSEDVDLVKHIFWGLRGGHFIEIGGYNGVCMSNTKMLERHFGWSGMLIEAHPVLYSILDRMRPHANRFNCAVCDSIRTIEFGIPAGGGGLGAGRAGDIDGGLSQQGKIHVPCMPFKYLTAAAQLTHVSTC